MKLHFEPNLPYQSAAIEAVCGLFHGQETCRTDFTVTRHAVGGGIRDSDLLRSDVKARHDEMVGLVETMLKLHSDSSRLTADSLRLAASGD
ncbi:MAG: hypothetical protein NTX53_07720 [candidate division WOR-3 bacterium]|nr:hypothetical protein [candidate division WOR-3 bacterium]